MTSTLPTGTITFLFTDLVASTRAWEAHPEAMGRALARHDALLRAAVEDHRGAVFTHGGDGIGAAFGSATDAMDAVAAAWNALRDEPCNEVGPLRVRMGLHTGSAELRDGNYFGSTVNRCARLAAIAHGGQVVCSLVTAELARAGLPTGARLIDRGEHRLRDLRQRERVIELRLAGQEEEFPPLRSLNAFRHNLPVQRTTFVGRRREIADLSGLLREARLVTLLGMGGAGKTRLALQVAAEQVGAFDDGVLFVELAAISATAALPEVVTRAIGLEIQQPISRGRLERYLAEFLAPQRVLLILDNAEHMVEAAASLVDGLLQSCPRLTVLVTAREPLRVAEERVWRVPPLSLPAAHERSPSALLESEAVRLFVERAAAAHPGFVLRPADAAAVAEICRRLDGIPLALELAAARARHLSPEQIRAHLDERFRLLNLGNRGSAQRHRTLQAALDWSHEMLDDADQSFLRRLAVFADGWTAEAAIACGREGDDALAVLDRMGSLVDRCFVVLEDTDATPARYRFLETVREYATVKLRAAGEEDAARERYLAWCLGLVERVPILPFGSLMRRSIELAGESENLRAALDLCLGRSMTDAALQIGARLWGIRISQGRFDDALGWTEALVALPAAGQAEAWNAVLLGAAHVRIWTGGFAAAAAIGDRLIAISRGSRLAPIGPAALFIRALASTVTGDAEPEALLWEAIERGREVGDRGTEAEALWNLGDLRMVGGDYAEGAALIEGGLELLIEQAPRSSVAAHCLVSKSLAAHLQGDTMEALRASDRALTLARELGTGSTYPTVDLVPKAAAAHAIALAAAGRAHDAHPLLLESLRATARFRLPLGTADCLAACAAVAFLAGDLERAGRLLAAARAQMRKDGSWRRISSAAIYRHYVDKMREALPREVALRAREEGGKMSTEAAVAYASQPSGPR